MGTDMEFGEFADWGGGVVSHVSLGKYIKNKQKKKVNAKALVRVGLQVCITLETVYVQVRVCAGQAALSGGSRTELISFHFCSTIFKV